MARTLVLGAGFGGLAVAHELRRLLGEGHEIVLVDRRERFAMGLRKLWELVGHSTVAEGSRPRSRVGGGVDFRLADVEAIDPDRRGATVGGEWISGDHLVIALGAEPRPDLVPGLAEHGHDVWDVAEVARARGALARFDGGRVLVVIAGVPYTCPPAPYECAMLVADALRARGVRDRAEIEVSTVTPILLPAAGAEGSAFVAELLGRHGIVSNAGRAVERVEPGRVLFADDEQPFDLLIGVPPHRPPAVVGESGLAGESGWIEVDAGTLETRAAGVYAIGDVTAIPLANGLPMPKAGVIAELEGRRVAAAIAADVRGDSPPPPFDGRGFCFLETGLAEATYVEGDFYASPAPRVAIREPSAESADAKRRFESERLASWFGG
jgi:sulfide:quinone oxidoreductase